MRKSKQFDEARNVHKELKRLYNNFKPIHIEKLWLDYNEKITNWNNNDLINDANELLSKINQKDNYEKNVYIKTTLSIVKYFFSKKDYRNAEIWLFKLNHNDLNTNGFYYNEQWFSSDKKIYFLLLSKILIELSKYDRYLDNLLDQLSFNKNQHKKFKNYIIESITKSSSYNNDIFINIYLLARYIKTLQGNLDNISKTFKTQYVPNNKITVSDLSHFVYCPVSYAINKSIETSHISSWEEEEWIGSKKRFIDRYNLFKNKGLKEAFSDSIFNNEESLNKNFSYFFNSKLIVDNVSKHIPEVFECHNKILIGAPDYVLVGPDNRKYIIIEKFSNVNSSSYKRNFESDLIKVHTYLNEFNGMNLEFGYLITWFWKTIKVNIDSGKTKNKIIVNSYRITRINKSEFNKSQVRKTLKSIYYFKNRGFLNINLNNIYPSKCFNCSAFTYCNHKLGINSKIRLPYQ